MQLFEAMTLMAGVFLPDGRPLAGELETVSVIGSTDMVKFKDGSYIAVNQFSCSYEPGTSTKVFASINKSYLRYAEEEDLIPYDTLSAETVFRELCFKVAKIY